MRRAGVDRVRLQRHDGGEERDRQAREQDVERDLVRGLAPLGALDERDHAVEERLARAPASPGSRAGRRAACVPPVTAERSPPASRITGADSPVIADSSTEPTPSMISPSAGMTSPALDDDDVAALELGRRHLLERAARRVRRCAVVVVRVARSAFACALPRPSAIASAKFANSTVSQSQNAITPTNQSWSVWPRARSRKKIAGRDHAAELDDEHHRVLELAAAGRASGTSRGPRARDDLAARRCLPTRAPSTLALRLVECEVELEDVDARLAEEAPRAAVGVLRDQLLHGRERQVPDGGDPARLELRVGGRDVGVDAGAGGRDRVDRDVVDRSGPGCTGPRASGSPAPPPGRSSRASGSSARGWRTSSPPAL